MKRKGQAPQLVSSVDNRQVRRIRQLQTRAGRDRAGLFFVDGVRFVDQALRRGADIETLVTAPDLVTSPVGRRIVAEQRQAGRLCLTVTPAVYAALATAEDPQGLGAVIHQRWLPLMEMTGREGLCWVVLETVQSPGNLGTILRTSEAVGGAGLILVGESADPYHPAAVRATMGALFAQRLVRASAPALAEWKARRVVQFVGTSPSASLEFRAADYRFPVALVMGWERRGLSGMQRPLCDVTVRLPMVGRSDSLNLAVATGVILYELFERRRSGR